MLRLLPRKPDVVYTHPGFFRTMEANTFLHGALAFDFLASKPNAHRAGAWQGVRALAPLPVWGVLHLTVAVLILSGLYLTPKLCRAGLGFAAVLCGGEAGSFLYGYTHPGATAFGAAVLIYLSYMSTVAYREPQAVVAVDLEKLR